MIYLPFAPQVIYAFLASVMALILQHEDAVMRGGLIINLSMGILGRHGFSCHRTGYRMTLVVWQQGWVDLGEGSSPGLVGSY